VEPAAVLALEGPDVVDDVKNSGVLGLSLSLGVYKFDFTSKAPRQNTLTPTPKSLDPDINGLHTFCSIALITLPVCFAILFRVCITVALDTLVNGRTISFFPGTVVLLESLLS